MRFRYRISGVDCPNCAMKLERLMHKDPLLTEARLNFELGLLTVEAPEDADEDLIAAAASRVAADFEEGISIEPAD